MVNINVLLLVFFSFLQKPANYSPIPKWDQTTRMSLVPLWDAAHVILSAALRRKCSRGVGSQTTIEKSGVLCSKIV
jgi:hypothetical protein